MVKSKINKSSLSNIKKALFHYIKGVAKIEAPRVSLLVM